MSSLIALYPNHFSIRTSSYQTKNKFYYPHRVYKVQIPSVIVNCLQLRGDVRLLLLAIFSQVTAGCYRCQANEQLDNQKTLGITETETDQSITEFTCRAHHEKFSPSPS